MTTMSTDELTTALQRTPPEIPSHYGYDAAGSELYAEIMQLNDYYLPAAETSLLRDYGAEIMTHADPTGLIDLGAGTAEKTEYLLRNAPNPLSVTLLDVDPVIIESAAARLRTKFPQHHYSCHQGMFQHARPATSPGSRTLIAFLGSTIGKLCKADRIQLLKSLATQCQTTDTLLLTADLHDDADRIESAYRCGYDAHESVRTKFALNRLESLNTIWAADFNPEMFTPGAYYDEGTHDVIAFLRSDIEQCVTLQGLGIKLNLEVGSDLIRDRMHKFTWSELNTELNQSGWTIDKTWIEKRHGYAAVAASPLAE